MTLRLGFLASHGGSNVQVIIDACGSGTLDAEPCVLVSNNSDAAVMARVRTAGISLLRQRVCSLLGRLFLFVRQ